MYRLLLSVALMLTTLPAQAWNTPEQAVGKFAEFDLHGGRLSSQAWADYRANYLHAPADYEEPGWDTVVVVDGYKVGKPACVAGTCTVPITYRLHPTRELKGPPVVPHEAGGTETVEIRVSRKGGHWKMDPQPDYPRISLEQYRKLEP